MKTHKNSNPYISGERLKQTPENIASKGFYGINLSRTATGMADSCQRLPPLEKNETHHNKPGFPAAIKQGIFSIPVWSGHQQGR